MKAKNYLYFIYLLALIFTFDSHAYEILNETLRITPGCEGGVLYSKIESGNISSISEHMNLNIENNTSTDREFSFEGKEESLVQSNL